MNKRGPIFGIFGIGLILVSFLVVFMVIPNYDPTLQGEVFLPNILEGMFDEVTSEVQVFPQESYIFSFSTSTSEVPLLWSLQITDFQVGDEYEVKISNIFGDDFGNFQNNEAILFEMFMIPKTDIYNFEVENTGTRPISVIMMFSEDPDNSEAFSDPNSPIMSTLLPLAISGIILIAGIIVIIVGLVISYLDWKKEKNKSRYL